MPGSQQPKTFLFLGILLVSLGLLLGSPTRLNSASFTELSNTLQSSRLSGRARLDTGNVEGGSLVTIKSTASAPHNTISTANLRAGDAIRINSNTYTVTSIVNTTQFTVDPVLGSGDADENDPVYLIMKPRHTITFKTATAVKDGYFQILIPADSVNPNDGLPDDDGFDFGGGSVTVTASDIGNYEFIEKVATPAGGTYCTAPANYHCFHLAYYGDGAIGTTITVHLGQTNGANSMVAPVESSSHTPGVARTFPYIVKQFAPEVNPSTTDPIDQSSGRIALVEAVRVTATVDPTISFTITGVDTAATTCGVNPSIDTSTGPNAPLAVPFGTMTLNTFKNAAHNLEVSTNAVDGYVVTALENDELLLNGVGPESIPDTQCNTGPCTISSSQEWTTATNNGFGYSLQNIDAASIAFQYNDSGGTFRARPFANLAASHSPVSLFSSTTVANAENIYVCYRLSVGATQAAGDYENQITYTATGTF